MTINKEKLRAAAMAATPGPWMRLFGERTVYDRMEDGCRGVAIARADTGFTPQDAKNLDHIAISNPSAVLSLLDALDKAEKDRDELHAALEQFATWGRMQHKAQSKGCHATFDMMSLRDEINLAEAAISEGR